MTIHSLNKQGTVQEAPGFLAEAVEAEPQKIVVIQVTKDGFLEGQGFGEVTVSDLCLFGAYLQKRAMDAVDTDR